MIYEPQRLQLENHDTAKEAMKARMDALSQKLDLLVAAARKQEAMEVGVAQLTHCHTKMMVAGDPARIVVSAGVLLTCSVCYLSVLFDMISYV